MFKPLFKPGDLICYIGRRPSVDGWLPCFYLGNKWHIDYSAEIYIECRGGDPVLILGQLPYPDQERYASLINGKIAAIPIEYLKKIPSEE